MYIYPNITSKHILKHHQNICQSYTNITQKFLRKQGRIHGPHLICHLPCSFIRPKVLPLHFNFLDCSVPKHEKFFMQYSLRFWLEFSIWIHFQYRLFNHMINIFNILLKHDDTWKTSWTYYAVGSASR